MPIRPNTVILLILYPFLCAKLFPPVDKHKAYQLIDYTMGNNLMWLDGSGRNPANSYHFR